MKLLKDFIIRLTSRKFLLATGTALTAYGQGNERAALVAVGAYIGVEGLADIVAAFAKAKYQVPAEIRYQTQLVDAGLAPEDDRPKVIVPGSPS